MRLNKRKICYFFAVLLLFVVAYEFWQYTSMKRTILRSDEEALEAFCLDVLERAGNEDLKDDSGFYSIVPMPQDLKGPQPIEAMVDARGNVCIIYQNSAGVGIAEEPLLALVYSSKHVRPIQSATSRGNFTWTHLKGNWYWMVSS